MWIVIMAGVLGMFCQQEVSLNTMCPVMTDEEADPEITVHYKGRKVALCCDGCVKKFTEAPETYLPNLPQLALAAPASPSAPPALDRQLNMMCPVMVDEEADPEITVQYKGQVVALCCDGCVEKFTENPEKYLANLPQFSGADARPGQEASVVAEESPRMPLVGRLHPAIIHVPIAAIPLALVAFIAAWADRRGGFAQADVVPLFAAAVTAVAAYLSGDIAFEHKRYSESLALVAQRHETCSTAVLIIILLLVILRVWRWNRLEGAWHKLYGCGLVVSTGLVGLTGYLGGSLVFGQNHLF